MKLGEDVIELVFRNAGPFVGELDHDAAVRAAGLEDHRGARRRILGGVVEQVDQHLLQEHRVEGQHRQLGLDVELDAMLGQHPGAALQRRAGGLADIDHLTVQFDGAGLEPGHVEQVANEAVQPLALLEDRSDELPPRLRIIELVVGL